MEKISSYFELQLAIQMLEEEREVRLQRMKKCLHQTYESFEPVNLIQNSLKEITTSPYLADNLLSAGVGIAAGYVSKIAFTNRSSNLFSRFLGMVLQFGITNIIAQNPKTVRAVGQYISQRIKRKEA